LFGAAIDRDDILVVNWALPSNAQHGNTFMAEANHEFTGKYLHKHACKAQIRAADQTFRPSFSMTGGP